MSNMTVWRGDDSIIGWIRDGSNGGCGNHHCIRALAKGRPYHAIPAGFAVTLDDYHFETVDGAREAIEDAMEDHPGIDRERIENERFLSYPDKRTDEEIGEDLRFEHRATLAEWNEDAAFKWDGEPSIVTGEDVTLVVDPGHTEGTTFVATARYRGGSLVSLVVNDAKGTHELIRDTAGV